MNFLSHYYLTHDDNDNYFTIGLTLPDILSFHNSGGGVGSKYLHSVYQNETNQKYLSLVRGMLLHLKVDLWFHKHNLFGESMDIVQDHYNEISEHHLPQFIAHILVEVLIDRYILGLEPDIADRYYESFNRMDFFEILPILQNTRDFHQEKFMAMTIGMAHSTFLREYTDDYKILGIFERINSRKQFNLDFKLESDKAAEYFKNSYLKLLPNIKLILEEALCLFSIQNYTI